MTYQDPQTEPIFILQPENTVEALESSNMTSEEIVDLKLMLLRDHDLLERVSIAFTEQQLEHLNMGSKLSHQKQLEHAIYYATQAAIVLTELIALPEDEWSPGYANPKEYALHLPLQIALRKSTQIPNELASISPRQWPQEWQDWQNGQRPNPLLSDDEIELLQQNGETGFNL